MTFGSPGINSVQSQHPVFFEKYDYFFFPSDFSVTLVKGHRSLWEKTWRETNSLDLCKRIHPPFHPRGSASGNFLKLGNLSRGCYSLGTGDSS